MATKKRITKRMVDDFKFPEGETTSKGKPIAQDFLWCTDPVGFGVRVSREGRRTFIVQGRIKGKNARLTIGPYGVFTVEQAREVAREHLRNMRMGVDPRDLIKEKEASEVSLQNVANAYTSRPGKLKESTTEGIQRHVTTTFESWKDKPISSITEADCRKRYREMLTGGLRGKAPAPGQANQGFAVLRALINFASRQYKKADGTALITHNPVIALKDDWVTLPERKTRIPESKIGLVWNTLQEKRKEAFNHCTSASIDVVIFLLLTGSRRNEACSLTWDRVDLEEGWWHLPDPKNRNPVWLPLSTQAIELLKTRERVEGSPYVFPSWRKTGHIKDPRDIMSKISQIAGMKITPHDLRRTFTTFGVTECDIDLHKIELLTNHVPKGVTARHYLETSYLQYLKPEVQVISDWIENKAREAQQIANGDNVIQLTA